MTTAELLRTFCARDDVREFLNNPMRKDGRLYASDGCVLVRVADDPTIAAGTEVPVNFSNLLTPCDTNAAAMLPLDVELPAPEPCDQCAGTGRVAKMVEVPCEHCHDGTFKRGTHAYVCRDCDGNGYTETPHATESEACHKCGGDGAHIYQTVRVGGVPFARHYLAKLQALPNIRMWTAGNIETPAAFAFDGGVGVLMPCRERQKDKAA